MQPHSPSIGLWCIDCNGHSSGLKVILIGAEWQRAIRQTDHLQIWIQETLHK